jgi:CBS domain-containing protein
MDRSPLKLFIDQSLAGFPLDPALTVSPTDTVRCVVQQMQSGNHSSVLAMRGDVLAGIFTERDVLTKCMAPDFDWDQPLEAAVLTREPRTIGANRSVAEAIATMQQRRYRSLPVVQDGRVVGLIRLGTLLRQLAEAYPETVLNLPPRPHQVMEKPEGG